MIDLRLITILPPQPVQAVSQPQIAGGGQGQVINASNLQIGSILSGFIINRDLNGNPILRTDSGEITFSSNFFLKIGSEITIRVEHIAGNNSAHILSVNGEAPEIATAQSSFNDETEVIIRNPAANNNSTSSKAATVNYNDIITSNVEIDDNAKITLNAKLISPAIAQDGKPVIPNQSQIMLKIINITQPIILQQLTTPSSTTTQPQTTILPSSLLQEGKIPAEVILQNQDDTPLQQNFIATPIKTTSIIIAPENEVATIQPSPQIGQQITAKVINNDTNGEPIVQTPLGILRLPANPNLAIGSQIIFEIEQIQIPENIEQDFSLIVANLTATVPAPLTQLARSAGALSDIFVIFLGLGTRDSNNFLNNNLPSIGIVNNSVNSTNFANSTADNKNFPSALLSFVSAIRTGDFRAWLGKDNAKWLEDNGYSDLLKKAEGEFTALSKQWTETPAQNWQTLFFPIAVNGQLEQVRLFVKKDKNEETKDSVMQKFEDTRFVLEMDLSQLGQMQMDGFVRRQEKSVQFDLVIRSNTSLSNELKQNITQIHNDTGEITGYQGSIQFQTLKDFPVKPMEDVMENKHEGIVA